MDPVRQPPRAVAGAEAAVVAAAEVAGALPRQPKRGRHGHLHRGEDRRSKRQPRQQRPRQPKAQPADDAEAPNFYYDSANRGSDYKPLMSLIGIQLRVVSHPDLRPLFTNSRNKRIPTCLAHCLCFFHPDPVHTLERLDPGYVATQTGKDEFGTIYSTNNAVLHFVKRA